ncbi:MAG TPA: cupin domain-containing protein [Acidobacteriaceae bacterium]|nr:cupin domain-containing protein [Acidobacteriaceae bacterium]
MMLKKALLGMACCGLWTATTGAATGPGPQPLTIPLAGQRGSMDLLTGAPQTAGMRSGFVRLRPGETVGWHTTGRHEETLVILHGKGAALVEGQPRREFAAPAVAYIPPDTRHNIENTGTGALEYVYVVAPAAAR